MKAIITGSARGIGAAIALKLAEDGYNIILNDVSEKAFENNDIVQKIKSFGVDCHIKIADVSDYEACEQMASEIKAIGSIDVLVNNAGITRDGLLARMSEELYDMVININQKSVFNMTKHIGNIMLRQKSGCIINVTSVAGLYGNAGQFNYSASKGALIAMTKTTAKELGGRGIRCNAVAPGFIRTPMTDKLTPEQQAEMLKAIALKRYGEPDEVANVVAFLCSEKASYITGQIIEISGGLSM
ncbi:MAG: 3-oxoacyl-[acyl-carrier-protein] reductase [Oscillospiraceae bacterium]|jgi:3-oxoacyl-[acyl-carrier protein] reductase|nr:3-oxoacyl-[acyl-carrier-protein] reductase [Oscillospiraceae bacterium]